MFGVERAYCQFDRVNGDGTGVSVSDGLQQDTAQLVAAEDGMAFLAVENGVGLDAERAAQGESSVLVVATVEAMLLAETEDGVRRRQRWTAWLQRVTKGGGELCGGGQTVVRRGEWHAAERTAEGSVRRRMEEGSGGCRKAVEGGDGK
ncbi:hypothetical protein PR002_g5528 [Phytophthora rubi]|uniref:Uncharacterized protein n=1 Tax=Phytophthora rubi TaxID=129364 RepID=A0A6A3NDN2_9STRA|nr:hypothetical protein PR002_g5528 [Phytophthora rubi]